MTNQTFFIIFGAIVFVLMLPMVSYNRFVRQRNLIRDSWSNVDTELRRRYDLIPNLVETVKGYAAHERGTLEEVTRARASASSVQLTPEALSDPEAMKKFQAAQSQLSGALSQVRYENDFRDPDDPFGFTYGDTDSRADRARAVATSKIENEQMVQENLLEPMRISALLEMLREGLPWLEDRELAAVSLAYFLGEQSQHDAMLAAYGRLPTVKGDRERKTFQREFDRTIRTLKADAERADVAVRERVAARLASVPQARRLAEELEKPLPHFHAPGLGKDLAPTRNEIAARVTQYTKQMADVLSEGIMKQFPSRFNNRTTTVSSR